ncbi:MAG: hypothetical protein ABI925_09795 [Verrucomicrobiota bacterium]
MKRIVITLAASFAIAVLLTAASPGFSSLMLNLATGKILDFKPCVTIVHPDGSSTYYQLAVNTSSDRGAALMNANSAAVPGDVILLGAGTFTITNIALAGGVSLSGLGIDATIIESNSNANAGIITPGSGSYLSGFTVTALRNDGTFQYPIGQSGGTAFGTCTIFNVKLVGDTDCLYNLPAGNTYKVYNSEFDSKWDTVSFGAGRAELYNCVLRAIGPTSVSGPRSARAVVAAIHSQILVMGGSCIADGGTSFNIAFHQNFADNDCLIEAHNVRVEVGTTQGTVPGYDAYKTSSGTLRLDNVVRADGSPLVLDATVGSIEDHTVRDYAAVPSTPSSPCNPPMIARGARYFYICTGTNTWKRVAISAW